MNRATARGREVDAQRLRRAAGDSGGHARLVIAAAARAKAHGEHAPVRSAVVGPPSYWQIRDFFSQDFTVVVVPGMRLNCLPRARREACGAPLAPEFVGRVVLLRATLTRDAAAGPVVARASSGQVSGAMRRWSKLGASEAPHARAGRAGRQYSRVPGTKTSEKSWRPDHDHPMRWRTYKERTEQQLCLRSRICGGPWSVVPSSTLRMVRSLRMQAMSAT